MQLYCVFFTDVFTKKLTHAFCLWPKLECFSHCSTFKWLKSVGGGGGALLELNLLWKTRKTGILLPSSLNLVPFPALESLSKKCWNTTWVWMMMSSDWISLISFFTKWSELWTEVSKYTLPFLWDWTHTDPLKDTSEVLNSFCAPRIIFCFFHQSKEFLWASQWFVCLFVCKILQWSFTGSKIFLQT